MKQCLKKLRITIWIRPLSVILSLSLLSLTGCTSKISGQMPSDGVSMAKVYQQAIIGGNGNDDEPATLDALRSQVANPIDGVDACSGMNQNRNQNTVFHRVANPDVRMYVYPHWAKNGSDEVPIPGYWTQFALFNAIHYNDTYTTNG